MSDQELETIVDEGIYNVYLKDQPSMIEVVADMLRWGQSPADIEAKLRHNWGDIIVVYHVRCIAEHLARHPHLLVPPSEIAPVNDDEDLNF